MFWFIVFTLKCVLIVSVAYYLLFSCNWVFRASATQDADRRKWVSWLWKLKLTFVERNCERGNIQQTRGGKSSLFLHPHVLQELEAEKIVSSVATGVQTLDKSALQSWYACSQKTLQHLEELLLSKHSIQRLYETCGRTCKQTQIQTVLL